MFGEHLSTADVTTTQLGSFRQGERKIAESVQCSLTRSSAAITPLGDA